MSEFNITVEGGKPVRLPTAGKYCDRDIIISAEGGEGGNEMLNAIIDGSITDIKSNATSIGRYAFHGYNLISADFPKATRINGYAFNECRKLTSINFPNVTYLDTAAFYLCDSLTSVIFPNLTENQSDGFSRCYSLRSADFPKITKLGHTMFGNCWILTAVILRSENLCTLAGTSVFNNCYHILGTVNANYNPDGLKDGYIYVPSALIEDYKNATNWSDFASQFRALEDYTVDGTITGELDQNKI